MADPNRTNPNPLTDEQRRPQEQKDQRAAAATDPAARSESQPRC